MTSTAWPQRGGVVYAPDIAHQTWLTLAETVHAVKVAAEDGRGDDAQRLRSALQRGWAERHGSGRAD